MGMEKTLFRFWNAIPTPINLDEFGKLALIKKKSYNGDNGITEDPRHTLRSTTLAKAYWILPVF
jgi:hypothetical protein